ncbi:MAG: enoyl-CoA hydratase/isomerase family protein [Pseudomonadota bacterium]
MNHKTLIVNQHDNGLTEIIMNRPDVHNAFNEIVIQELTQTLLDLQNVSELKLLTLRGSGKSFSAGADLNWMRSMANFSWDENYQDSLALATLMQTLHNFTRPTLAIVHGSTYGGGLGLVSACDFAVASANAKFCLSESKLGLIPAVISPYVVSAIGKRHASRFFYSAEVFDATQAMNIGLIQEVYPEENFSEHVETFLNSILSNGPQAICESKRLIENIADKPINEELIRDTAAKIADIRASAEGKEGVSAFLEKRKPDWNAAKNQALNLLGDDEV